MKIIPRSPMVPPANALQKIQSLIMSRVLEIKPAGQYPGNHGCFQIIRSSVFLQKTFVYHQKV
jgi:hypothetical protein